MRNNEFFSYKKSEQVTELTLEIVDLQIEQALFPVSAILARIFISGHSFWTMPLTQGLILARRKASHDLFARSHSLSESVLQFCGVKPG